MAENKLFNVRINHKFDTYANWLNSTIILGAGELAVALIDSGVSNSGLTPPTIGVKIGDGQKIFKDLEWIQAIAGDVHPWAKKENLDYADISQDFKDQLEAELISDTNTQYIFEVDGTTLTIKKYEKGQDPETQATILRTLTIADAEKVDKVIGTQGNLVAFGADGAIVDSGEKIGDFLKSAEAEGLYAPLSLEEDFSTLEGRVTALDAETTGRVSVLEEKMDVLNAEATVEGSVKKTVADAIAIVVNNAPEDFDTLKEIADWIASDKDGGAANLVTRLTAVEGIVTEHTGQIAALEEVALSSSADRDVLNAITAEDVAAWNAAEQNAKDYADGIVNTEKEAREALAERVTTAEGKVTTLEGIVGLTETDGLQGAVAGLEELSHDHVNKTILDGITEAKVTAWDAAIQAGNGVEVTTVEDKPVVSGVSTDLLKDGTKELVLECGDSGAGATS